MPGTPKIAPLTFALKYAELRIKGLSQRATAKEIGIALSTQTGYLRKARVRDAIDTNMIRLAQTQKADAEDRTQKMIDQAYELQEKCIGDSVERAQRLDKKAKLAKKGKDRDEAVEAARFAWMDASQTAMQGLYMAKVEGEIKRVFMSISFHFNQPEDVNIMMIKQELVSLFLEMLCPKCKKKVQESFREPEVIDV